MPKLDLSGTMLVLLFLFTQAVHCAGPRFIFSFGDSYSSTFFNVGGTKPSQSNPLGNPAYGQNTSCAIKPSTYCPNWVDVLTVNLSSTNTLSYNFAVPESVVNNVDSDSLTAPANFSSQLKTFSGSVASKPSYAPWTAANSVFIAWFSVNDLLGIGQNSNTSKADINRDLNDLFTDLETLYTAGGRRFVLFNAPPLQEAPTFGLGNTNGPYIKGNATIWNNMLPTKASSFAQAHSGTTVKVLDTQPLFYKVLNDSSTYPHPWADLLHPADAIQSMVAVGAHDLLNSIGFYS